jgi:hypothetical protein
MTGSFTQLEEVQYLKAIAIHPDNADLYAEYAEYLKDKAPGRAETIRTAGIKLAEEGKFMAASNAMEIASNAWMKHKDEWAAPLAALGVEARGSAKGMPDSIDISVADFLEKGEAVLSLYPQLQVRFKPGASKENIEALKSSRAVKHIIALSLESNPQCTEILDALGCNEGFANLKHLDISRNGLNDIDVIKLFKSSDVEIPNEKESLVRELAIFDYISNGQNKAALAALRESLPKRSLGKETMMGQLVTLYAGGNKFGDEALSAIADSWHSEKLEKLWLNGCQISDTGCKAVAHSRHLSSLKLLNLDHNKVTPLGEKAIADSPKLPKLLTFNVAGCYEKAPSSTVTQAVLAQRNALLEEQTAKGYRAGDPLEEGAPTPHDLLLKQHEALIKRAPATNHSR